MPKYPLATMVLHSITESLLMMAQGNIKCVEIWQELESEQKITTERMCNEIQSHLNADRFILGRLDEYLKKYRFLLSVDAIKKYRIRISEIRVKMLETSQGIFGEQLGR